MFQKSINRYLINKNKELERDLKKYISDEKRVSEITKNLSDLETEWNSEIEKLKIARREYETIIREVKILRSELLRAKKRKEALDDSV